MEQIEEAHELRNISARPERAIIILEELADQVMNDPLLSYDYPKILKMLAICYSDTGKTKQSFELLQEALEAAKKDLNEIESADIRTQLAFLQLYMGNLEESEEYAKKAWKYIGKKRGERFTNTKSDTARVLGKIKFEQASYKKSLRFFRESLRHAESVEYLEGMISAFVEIGNHHIVHERMEKADKIVRGYLDKVPDSGILYAKVEMLLARIAFAKKDMRKAKEYANRAYKVFKAGKFTRLLAESSQLLGTVNSEKNQKAADAHFKEAFDIYNEFGFKIPTEHPKEKDWYTDFEDV